MPFQRRPQTDERSFMFVACGGPRGAVDKRAKSRANRHVMLNLMNGSPPDPATIHLPPRMVIKFNANADAKHVTKDAVRLRAPGELNRLLRRTSNTESSTSSGSFTTNESSQDRSRSTANVDEEFDFVLLPVSAEEASDVEGVLSSIGAATLNAAQHRVGIHIGFCNVFFPQEMNVNPTILEPRQGNSRQGVAHLAAQQAGDALCTLTLGVARSSPEWIFGSMKMYSAALKLVQRAIDHIDWSQPLDNLTIAVYYLLKYEFSICRDYTAPAWQQHTRALLRVVALQHRARSKNAAAATWALAMGPYYVQGHGLLTKKAIEYQPVTSSDGPTAIFFNAAMRIPAWLEELEILTNSVETSEIRQSTVREGFELRRELCRCMDAWLRSEEGHSYRTVPVDEFPILASAMDKDLLNLYPLAYRFASLISALIHRIFWTTLLELDNALLDLIENPASVQDAELSANVLRAERTNCADHLCRSLAHISANDQFGLSSGLAILEPLHFIESHFRNQNDEKKSSWCCAIREQLVTGAKVAKILSISPG